MPKQAEAEEKKRRAGHGRRWPVGHDPRKIRRQERAAKREAARLSAESGTTPGSPDDR